MRVGVILGALLIASIPTKLVAYEPQALLEVSVEKFPSPRALPPQRLGDLNADGYGDFIWMTDSLELYLGNAAGDDNIRWTITLPNDEVPKSICRGPIDFNHDGHSDLLIGSPTADRNGMEQAGAVFAWWGGPAFDGDSDFAISDVWRDYRLGQSVCRVGRFLVEDTGDAIGVRRNNGFGWGPSPYAIQHFGGGAVPDTTATAIGSWLSSDIVSSPIYLGDRNGDGYGGYLQIYRNAAIWRFDPITLELFQVVVGAVHVQSGGGTGYQKIYGDDPDDPIGGDVAANCDLNADGYADIAVTMRGRDRTWLILSWVAPPAEDPDAKVLLIGGQSVASVGDLNGDGHGDLITLDERGRWMLYFSRPGFDGTGALVCQLPESEVRTPMSVEPAGDFDGDGVADYFVGLVEELGGNLNVETYRLYAGSAEIPVAVESSPSRRPRLSVRAAPNPFNPTARITFRGVAGKRAKITAYDSKGRRIGVPFDGRATGAEQQVVWDASGLASGVYFLRLSSADLIASARVTLVK